MLNIKHNPFCPCNTTTLPDGIFSTSVCILMPEIKIFLDAALSHQTLILLIKHRHSVYSESCLIKTPPAETVEKYEINCIGKQLICKIATLVSGYSLYSSLS